MIAKNILYKLYSVDKKSAQQISKILGVSTTQVNYWLYKFNITKRSISDAVYAKHNPAGDPFKVNKVSDIKKALLFGMGLGLYWGEGTKSNKTSVRLGNSDPRLVKTFIKFLVEVYSIDTKRLRFGLQIFNDLNATKLIKYWSNFLSFPESSFYKPIVTISGRKGTYKNKVKFGVLTVYFNNKKLRNILINELNNIEKLF